MRCKGILWKGTGLLLALFIAPGVLYAQDAVPIDQQATLLLKAISYDRNLQKRSAGGIHIAVIHKGADEAAAALAKAFEGAGKSKVKGLSVKATAVAFTSVQEILQGVDAQGFNVIYAHPSVSQALSSIQQVSRGKKILSLGANKKLVEQGLSLGVYLKKGKPRLVVNQKAAQVEGLDLAPAIKLISTVIK
jgi:hypothetical protein